MSTIRGWIGVDLDGTLAHYDGWKGAEHIGAPIVPMVKRVREWLANGVEVRIFTARVSTRDQGELTVVLAAIAEWTKEHIGVSLPATCIKDYAMVELWDDRLRPGHHEHRGARPVSDRLIQNTSCLPQRIEDMIRRATLDRFTGTVQLNIKDGVILGFHRNEIVSLPASEIRK